MSKFNQSYVVRWADLDPNFHVRHSAYYDYGAQSRIATMNDLGISIAVMKAQNFGPVIFREECLFKREILANECITVTVKLIKARADFSRWTMQHEIFKEDGTLCAIINLDGAWADTVKRKLASPTPKVVSESFEKFPKSTDFVLLP